jgi:hypothetical protein
MSDSYLLDRYPAGDRTVRVLVIDANDKIRMRHLGGLPSPMLIDLCSDGRPHEAWCSDGYWRAREDDYDAVHKPADVPYTRVIVGLNPEIED